MDPILICLIPVTIYGTFENWIPDFRQEIQLPVIKENILRKKFSSPSDVMVPDLLLLTIFFLHPKQFIDTNISVFH